MDVGYVALNTVTAAVQPRSTSARRRTSRSTARRCCASRGKFDGKRTDQILPPSLQGYRDAKLYPIKGADRPKARSSQRRRRRARSRSSTSTSRSAHRPGTGPASSTSSRSGLNAETKPLSRSPSPSAPSGTRGGRLRRLRSIGWVADYPDPFDFINVLLDGNNIQESNNTNYAYFNDARFNKQMNDFRAAFRPEPLRVVRQARRRPDAERGSVGAVRNARTHASSCRPASRTTSTTRSTPGAVLNALAIK